MGTSSARRAPTGHLWRLAKGAASRYLSPANGGAVEAREVAARYVAALAEAGGAPGPAGALAAFRLTRRLAQNLGAFCCQADSQGRAAALNTWGLMDGRGEPAALAASLSAALGEPGCGLEQAAAHAALTGLLLNLAESPTGAGTPDPASLLPEAPRLVRGFLADAFLRRLTFDLGASLEAAAPGFFRLRQGLTDLSVAVSRAAETGAPAPAPRTPEHWQGLPGWTWVSGVLEGLIQHLLEVRRS